METVQIEPRQIADGCIREHVLEDRKLPLHRIAGKLRPFLRVLQDQFHPEKVVVFGSYAYGTPDEDSDVDILVVKPIEQSRLKDKIAIRSAWWPLLRKFGPISFDLMLAEPKECESRSADGGSYLGNILEKGIRVI
jgi:predicted nucleotidyltransferase